MLTLLVLALPARAANPSAKVERALRNAAAKWQVPYRELRAVSWCESRWNPYAIGAGSHGLFQFIRSTWSATPYAHRSVYDPWWNALAAAWLVRQDGSWRQWTCRPW